MNNWNKCIIVPIYNEVRTAKNVIENILKHKDSNTRLVLVQDGSDDGSAELLRHLNENGYFESRQILFIDHPENLGYGKALLSGFQAAVKHPDCRYILTMDCDEQHQPEDIEKFFSDDEMTILSGSRYLEDIEKGIKAPEDRVQINRKITEKYIRRSQKYLGENWKISDTFCGMKRYSFPFIRDFIEGLDKINCSDECLGYGFPLVIWNFFLEWLKANNFQLEKNFREIAIPKIYISDDRTFGENLDFPVKRYRYYLGCMQTSFEKYFNQ